MPMHGSERDEFLEALELADDQGPVSYDASTSAIWTRSGGGEAGLELTPWTGVRDIEMIAALLRRELGTGFLRDPASERRLAAFELA